MNSTAPATAKLAPCPVAVRYHIRWGSPVLIGGDPVYFSIVPEPEFDLDGPWVRVVSVPGKSVTVLAPAGTIIQRTEVALD